MPSRFRVSGSGYRVSGLSTPLPCAAETSCLVVAEGSEAALAAYQKEDLHQYHAFRIVPIYRVSPK